MRVCVPVCVRARVCIISQCPEPRRSWNTSVALARFIKNPGYRPAVKIEAAYLLHFVQINLKTCESYSLERWGKEVNNIRLILTSRGRERTKIRGVLLLQELSAMLALPRRGLPGATLSCHCPHRLDAGLRVPGGRGSAPRPGFLSCTLAYSALLCGPLLSPRCHAAILLSHGSCRN